MRLFVFLHVMTMISAVSGAIVNGGGANRLAAASAQAADAEVPAFRAALDDRRGLMGLWVFWLITVAIVFVMIVKPLS